MKKKILFISLLLISACSSDDGAAQDASEPATISYTASLEDFPNPERGFYHYSETRASNYSPLTATELASYRTSQTADGATYSVVSTLVFRYFVLDGFNALPLEESFLTKVRADFVAARTAGVKLIPRFTYTVDANAGDCPESFICPPYGDAPKATVLGHIAQLKPILQENADVITCVQLGFFGTWGENYYTDYFGDASNNDQKKLLDQNWIDRIEVLQALLDATPKTLMVQVRYPQFKQRHSYGINAPVASAALTLAEAFSESDKARIGFHNDCFLASPDDYGTYEDYGNSSSPRNSPTLILRKYFADDSKYVVVGGETCNDNDYSPQNDCAPAGKAEKEMSDLHYSYLNMDYNNEVNNDWVTGGCMENIKKRLGYRFVLKSGTYPTTAQENEELPITLTLENTGFTSPFKGRPAQLIFRNTETNEVVVRSLDTDVRTWFPGTITLEETLEGLASGTWALFLNLPDAATSISNRAEYSIRLANEGVWEETTGYNALRHTITVE